MNNIVVSREILEKLFKIYRVAYLEISTYGDSLYCQLTLADSQLLDGACEAFEPHEATLRMLLDIP